MLSKNRINMFWFTVLIVLSIFFGLDDVDAGQYKSYPDCCIKEISNFKMYCDEIFQIVGNKMGLKVNERMPKPTILTDDQLTLQQFRSYLGWDVKEILPYYFHKNNIIVIPGHCKLDSLVHEFVHYFQVMYQNKNWDVNCDPYRFNLCDPYRFNLEVEAMAIQRWFKAKFMRPRLSQ